MKLKWTNKYSKEQGYVKSVKATKGYFENTFDEAEARNFRTDKEVQKALEQLSTIGETENNDFEVVD